MKMMNIFRSISPVFPYLLISLFTWLLLPMDKKADPASTLICLGTGLSLYLLKTQFEKRYGKKNTPLTLSEAKTVGVHLFSLSDDEKTNISDALGYKNAHLLYSPDGILGWRDIKDIKGGTYLISAIPDSTAKKLIERSNAKFIPSEKFSDTLRQLIPKENPSNIKSLLRSADTKKCIITSYAFFCIYIMTSQTSYLIPAAFLAFFSLIARHIQTRQKHET